MNRNLADTRAKAQALILAGRVRVDGQAVTKAGTLVAEDARVEVLAPASPYVSRGGDKLAAAPHPLPQNFIRDREARLPMPGSALPPLINPTIDKCLIHDILT